MNPKIKNNLDDRENKIKDDLDDANKFKELSESKFKQYEKIIAELRTENTNLTAKLRENLKKERETLEIFLYTDQKRGKENFFVDNYVNHKQMLQHHHNVDIV